MEGTNLEELIQVLERQCKAYSFQGEEGMETGYLHYQGCMSLKKRQRFHVVLEWLGVGTHLEPTVSVEKMEAYCQKEETRVSGPWTKVAEVKVKKTKTKAAEPQRWLRPVPTEWYPWQKAILDMIRKAPDQRTVHWVYDGIGGRGKTTLGHEICKNHDGVVVNGRLGDILALASEKVNNVYLVIAPRDQSAYDFPYVAIELLKDGLWMKGKYEVKSVSRAEMCHVIVLANCLPIMEKLTKDRWNIIEL